MSANNTTMLLDIKTQDSTVHALQDLVEKYKADLKKGGSAAIISVVTKSKGIGTTIILRGDTLWTDSLVYIYPIYTSVIDNEGWIIDSIVATKDTITNHVKIVNDFSLVLGYERQGLFKPRKPYAELTNKNPYTATNALRVADFRSIPPKKLGLGVNVGYGITAKGLTPYIGIGVNYNFIEIKTRRNK